MSTPREPTLGRRDDDVRAKIHRNAARHAEAVVYTMNNTYLTRPQKILVEAWFQFPIGVFGYLLMAYLAVRPAEYVAAFILSYVVAGIIALVTRIVPLPERLLVILGLLFAGLSETVVSVAFIAFFLYYNAWGAAVIALGSATGFLSVLSPSMHLYTILSPSGLHCKYAFAKSRFGIVYPFENRE
jgi:hypothetical protein